MAWNSRSATKVPEKPQLPDGLRIYAIGDVHGRADLLEQQFQQIGVDERRNPCIRSIIVFLGDYIDRGPASRQVLDLLLACKRKRETVTLKGNHETFLLRFLDDASTLDDWRSFGGLETLISYGLTPSICPGSFEQGQLAAELIRLIPKPHIELLGALEPSFCSGDFLFVHAGIRPGIAIGKQKEDDLLWIRDEFLSWDRPFKKFIVHGHTPVRSPDIRSNRANIDTGAFATGRLTCIAIEGSNIVPLVDLRDWRTGDNTRPLSKQKPTTALQGFQDPSR